MINVSTAFKQALENDQRNYIEKVDISLTSGQVLNLTNSDIWDGGLSFDDSVSSDDAFQVGAAIVNKCTIVLNNIYDDFTPYDFNGAKVVIWLGLEINGAEEVFTRGTYTVDEAVHDNSIVRLTCLDYMSKFDREYSDDNGRTLSYPATLSTIIENACQVCQVRFATSDFPHKSFVIQNRPDDEDITFREVLSYCAQIAGCYARVNPEGSLELKWFDISKLTDNPTEISSLYGMNVSVDDVIITGIKATVRVKEESSDEIIETYSAGSSGYMIDLGDKNPFITMANAQTIVDWLGSSIIGTTFRKANVQHPSMPMLEAGDVAVVVDRKSNHYPILITRTNFSTGDAQTTISAAETPARNSSARFSADVKNYVELKKLVQQEKTAREQAEEDLIERMDSKGGMYETNVVEQSGGSTYNLHNKPNLEDSNIILRVTDEAVALTNDGGEHWYGLTVDGALVTRMLYAVGINADHINTGRLSVNKDGKEVFAADMDTGEVKIAALENPNVGGVNIIRGTNTTTTLSSGDWGKGTWDATSSAKSRISFFEVSNTSNANIKRGFRFANTSNVSTDIMQRLVPLARGYEYTFSCYAKGTGILAMSYGSSSLVTKTFTLSNVARWQKVSWTVTTLNSASYIPTYTGGVEKTTVYFGNHGTGTLEICGMKVESGSTATDWSPAPEDVTDEIINETEALDESLNQRAIFNRLTQNGSVQGLYLKDNKVYINASYIQTGTLSAGIIKTGVIQDKKALSTWNLDTGVMNLQLNSLKVKIGNSYVAVSPNSFRVQNSALSWKSTNSSMSSSGVLSCKGASIEGRLKAGNYNSGSYLDINGGSINVYRDKVNVGYMQANVYTKNKARKGLVFDLEPNGSYMSWSYRKNPSDKNFTMQWTFVGKNSMGSFRTNALNAGCDIDMHGHKIYNIYHGLTKTLTFHAPTSIRRNGTIAKYKSSAKLIFTNGIFTGCRW